MGHEKPPKVREAILNNDHDALVRMAKKGAEHTALRKEFEEERKEEALAEQARLYRVDKEGDVLPPETEE